MRAVEARYIVSLSDGSRLRSLIPRFNHARILFESLELSFSSDLGNFVNFKPVTATKEMGAPRTFDIAIRR